jgi:hypothetical protein
VDDLRVTLRMSTRRSDARVSELWTCSDANASDTVATSALLGRVSLSEMRRERPPAVSNPQRQHHVLFFAVYPLHQMRHAGYSEKPQTRPSGFFLTALGESHHAFHRRTDQQVRRLPPAVLRLAAGSLGRSASIAVVQRVRRWIPVGATSDPYWCGSGCVLAHRMSRRR